MEKRRKKTYIIFLVGFFIGVLLFTGTFLMYLNEIDDGIIIIDNVPDEEYIMPGGLVFNSIDKSLHLEGVTPTLDKFGVMGDGFSFSIKNNNLNSVLYELSLVDNDSTIQNSNIRYELIKNGESLGVHTLADNGVLEVAYIKENELVSYTIKLWLDYNSEVVVGKLSKRIGIKEVDKEENGIKPVLVNGMIPVYYNNETNSWYKVDSNNLNNEWYDYEELIWANAVTVNEDKRSYYESSASDTKIEIDDINSMWVWIPRFDYNISSNEVNIHFVSEKEKAHLAFTFNDNELSGFWFSKFEASMHEDDECITSSLTKICNSQNNKLYFVPNYPFATKITMANMFYIIRKMELKNNIYGFNNNGTKLNSDGTITGDSNSIDTHMVKNSEWEAVALLSLSKYGNKEIANNNSAFAGKSYFDNNEYDYNVLLKGESASTTGNVTGVYDMVGGKREYVMLNTSEINIFNKTSNSGFTTNVKNYYYDNGLLEESLLLKDKYGIDNKLNKEPITRGGYKNTGNIFSIYGPEDYIDKISVETNSRASLVIMKENSNE